MKRLKSGLLFALIMVFACSALLAQAPRNTQKIHAVNSEVYQPLTYLYIDQAMALPSTTGPWSTDELLMLLGKIDSSRLTPNAQDMYDYAAAQLTQGDRPFEFGFEATL